MIDISPSSYSRSSNSLSKSFTIEDLTWAFLDNRDPSNYENKKSRKYKREIA